MPKYMCFFSYTREAGQAMIEKPTDPLPRPRRLWSLSEVILYPF
jgi:hypothetical protein